jgi:predicted metal-binding membrane protein
MDMSALRMTALPAAMEPGPATSPWTPAYGLLMLVMWWVMMIAMMVPSAAPMILLFAAVNRRQRSAGGTFVPTGIFLSGYLLAWGGFSLVAVALQWGLERAALLSAMMASTSAVFGAALLLAAGIYQLTPLKQACLRHCRSPLHFVTHGWRRGRWGAFRMGLEHGAFCLGCCWFLMGLLFYGGVMNLYWIAGVAVLVLLEKTVPAGRWLGLAIGVGLILWGGTVLVAAL